MTYWFCIHTGIVLTRSRGVASVALRSLAIAAECLTVRREQEEVLQIFEKIRQETGWRVGFLNKELKEKWGWQETPPQPQQQQQLPAPPTQMQQTLQPYPPQALIQPQVTLQPQIVSSLPPAPPVRPRIPGGIPNPLLATADFSMPQHPYQSYYVAPNPLPPPAHFVPDFKGFPSILQ